VSSLSRGVQAVVVLAVRNLLKNVRTPMLLVASLLQPLLWLVMFSQTFRRLGDTPQLQSLGYHSYLSFLLPGMVVLAVLFAALQSGIATVADIDSGMLDKLLISPISRSSILLGRVLADTLTILVQATIVLAVGLLLGANVTTGVAGMLALLGFVTLFGLIWVSLTNLIALRSRNAEATMVAGLLLNLPAIFLSPAFFPLKLQPSWLQTVAKANPAAYVIETGQQLTSLGNQWHQDVKTLLVLAVAGPLLGPAAVAAFRAATR
jgi:ABC-2 type transport system permease protein